MYFAIMVLSFPSGPDATKDNKDTKSLIERIRSRFKVCARQVMEKDGTLSIAIATLHPNQNDLTQQLDSIIEHCETSGFGRVESEKTLFDHIDAIEDYASDDEAE